MAFLISAMIFALSEVNLNTILDDVITSIVSSSNDYVFPDQFYNIDESFMKNPVSMMIRQLTIQDLVISDYKISFIPSRSMLFQIGCINATFFFSWEYSVGGLSDSGSGYISMSKMTVSAPIDLQNSNYFKAVAGSVTVSIPELSIKNVTPDNINTNWVFQMFNEDIADYFSSSIKSLFVNAINSFQDTTMFANING